MMCVVVRKGRLVDSPIITQRVSVHSSIDKVHKYKSRAHIWLRMHISPLYTLNLIFVLDREVDLFNRDSNSFSLDRLLQLPILLLRESVKGQRRECHLTYFQKLHSLH